MSPLCSPAKVPNNPGWVSRFFQSTATWSNLPIIMVQPAGVLIKDMTTEQRRAAHALMRATIGPVFSEIANSLVDAFCRRAAEVYGRAGIDHG